MSRTRRRRIRPGIVVALAALLAFALLIWRFDLSRAASSRALHLGPFGALDSLVHAKAEHARLVREHERLMQGLVEAEVDVQENVQLRALARFQPPPALAHLGRVNTEIEATPSSADRETVMIFAGERDGVREGDLVVSPAGDLIGTVVHPYSYVSRVRLLTSVLSAMTVTDAARPSLLAEAHRGSSSNALVLDRVRSTDRVNVGDSIITAGRLGSGHLRSLYPCGLRVGTVTAVSVEGLGPYELVQVHPTADVSPQRAVMVFLSRSRR